MQPLKWHPDTVHESDTPQPETLQARADRLGVVLSLLMACVALLALAAWFVSGSSFEKCSALDSQSERYICYDQLRDEMARPAKGAHVPALTN